MPATILITGAGGQVGYELARARSDHLLVALGRSQLDITRPLQIEEAFASHRPDLVINAAAYTQVDRAEHEAELAFRINRDGVADLAFRCQEANIPLLHISTDYVFDGSKRGPYVETDSIAPLGIYGESKAEGEAVLHGTLEKHIILRTSWVFSATGANFVKTMLRLGKERDHLGIVDDQHGCPTSAHSIAETLLTIANRYLDGETIAWGTYHYCNQPGTTWYRFAVEIFRQAGGYDKLKVEPIATSEFPTPAQRPYNSVLDSSKIRDSLGIEPADWSDELGLVLGSL